MKTRDWDGIWVVAEQAAGCLNSVSFELLGKARSLKAGVKSAEHLTAVLLGHNIKHLAPELAKYGAEKIIIADDPALELFQNDAYTCVLEDIIRERKPSVVLMGATGVGSDLAPTLGARLKTGVTAHCIDVSINEDSELVSVVPAFGGKVLGEILCPQSRPQIATVKAGVLGKAETCPVPDCIIETYNPAVALTRDKGRVKALGMYQEEVSGVKLEDAEIVVAGGWGMASKENWQLLEELAGLIGGAVGCTRPPVDEGWVSGEHLMIGTSGKTVRPKVYIGAALSGSTHHVCGMKDSGYIISINKDAKAPIFEVSDLRIVGDAKTIISLLIDEIKKVKA